MEDVFGRDKTYLRTSPVEYRVICRAFFTLK